MKNKTDAELVTNFMNGCKFSYEELIRRYEVKVKGIALKITGNLEDSEEIAQDTFINVYNKISHFRGESKFSSWLFRIASNNALIRRRRYKYDQLNTSIDTMQQFEVDKALFNHTESQETDVRAISNQQHNLIKSEVKKLPRHYRECFTLREIQGLDYPEIKKTTGICENTIKTRTHRAKLMLRKKLACA